LGKVPSAKNADHATTATSALTATSATNATNATNATTAANATNATTAATATRATSAASTDGYFNSGLVTLSASTTSPGVQQTLTTRGPFSFIAQCLDNGGGSYAASLIVKDNSATGAIEEDDYDGNYSPPTTLNVGDTHNAFYPTTDTTPYWYGEYYNMFSVAAPGGPALSGEGSIGVHVLGAACAFQLVLYG
ncbi:MAG TPA: hypothetical protein VG295_09655, partial [Solirubrobacteraceae bacterium]|nr:hypothetical protein [Solirubrobacteraceae bacterium]